ncbi:hypothetical protein LSH36_1484g00002 [Paralvinella palmiformis]|uniref:Uncharacterized protein n=1 Tax=Paralvinella palmiformis TaxID=53620 RepID=A0AAD9ISW6_9ANNE|nr:hypothetical protein LSH36_1484g00002 [Paralvinella palmiformis]
MTELERFIIIMYSRTCTPSEVDEARNQLFTQRTDIGFDVIDPKPGSGEYWGARHYISSVEIKRLVLSMLLGKLKLANYDGRPIDYTAEADDETLALLTVVSISFFNHLFIDRRQMKYLYFDTALCSLLSDMKTENARRALHNIIEELLKNSKS